MRGIRLRFRLISFLGFLADVLMLFVFFLVSFFSTCWNTGVGESGCYDGCVQVKPLIYEG